MPLSIVQIETIHYGQFPEVGQPTIYLEGPTKDTNWHAEAVNALEELHFKCAVFIPTPLDGIWREEDANRQREWQLKMQRLATVIMCWVPRPRLVTFAVFGEWSKSGKMVLGLPVGAEQVAYLRFCARYHGVPMAVTLPQTANAAVKLCASKMFRPG